MSKFLKGIAFTTLLVMSTTSSVYAADIGRIAEMLRPVGAVVHMAQYQPQPQAVVIYQQPRVIYVPQPVYVPQVVSNPYDRYPVYVPPTQVPQVLPQQQPIGQNIIWERQVQPQLQPQMMPQPQPEVNSQPAPPLAQPAPVVNITSIQKMLSGRGYYSGAISGVIDGYTKTAISLYQKDVGLTVTGEADLVLENMLQYGPDVHAHVAPIGPSVHPAKVVNIPQDEKKTDVKPAPKPTVKQDEQADNAPQSLDEPPVPKAAPQVPVESESTSHVSSHLDQYI